MADRNFTVPEIEHTRRVLGLPITTPCPTCGDPVVARGTIEGRTCPRGHPAWTARRRQQEADRE